MPDIVRTPSSAVSLAHADIAHCRAALATRPDDAALHAQLAASLAILGQHEEACAAYAKSMALTPVNMTICAYAALLMQLARHEEAIQICRAALQDNPGDTHILNQLGLACQACGQLEPALAAYQQILLHDPDSALAHNNIGSVLQTQDKLDTALEHFGLAIRHAPYFDYAHFNQGTCLMRMGRHAEALASFEQTIKLNAHHHLALVNLIAMQSKLGMLDASIATCRTALACNPDWADIHSNLLFTLTHSTKITVKQLFAEHRQFAVQFEKPWRASWPRHGNDRDPERRLRVGFVSGDWNHHAMANFIVPILEQLIHATGLELFIYSNNHFDDFVTAQLRTLVPQWRDIHGMSDDIVTQVIQEEQIDILIDLSGHTGYNRLPAFARKPAPLQLTWIGYPFSTGLEAVDYFFTDRYFSPAGLLDDQFTEKCVRLPATVPFMPAADAPPVAPAPCLTNGHITFGSFNRPNKFSDEVIRRWCTLLKAVPQAHMVLGGMPSEQISDMLRATFVAQGVASERLHFYLNTNTHDYLALHRLVDICLDTSPYAGGTTTFHALWMGVPTLTMTGAALPSRVGANILGHAGLAEFIARDETDFLQKGIALAGEPAMLAELRAGMRTRMNNAAVGQPALIAAGVDAALRTMWRRWCSQLPAVSFDADPEQSSLFGRAASLQSLHQVNVEAALLLAIDHHQADRLVEAETLYLAILHQQPRHAIANHNMGLLAMQLGLPQDALPFLATAHAAAPDEVQFCHAYVQGLLRAGQTHQARDVVDAAIARGLDAAPLHALQSQILAELAHAAQQPPQADADHIVALYESGDISGLETMSRTLTERYPDSGFAWSALGTALQLQGKDALAALQKAVQLTPGDAQAHSNLGNAWRHAGQDAFALVSYRQAIALDPGFVDAYGNMAATQEAMGLPGDAIASYQQALAIEPSYEVARDRLACLLAHDTAAATQGKK